LRFNIDQKSRLLWIASLEKYYLQSNCRANEFSSVPSQLSVLRFSSEHMRQEICPIALNPNA